MGQQRRRNRTIAAALTPLVVALTVGAGSPRADAATGNRSDAFAFHSDVTDSDVQCTVTGSLSSTQRSGGDWALTTSVRISEASSPECYDGYVHLTTHSDAADGNFDGGGSFVQVSATTPTEVYYITYQLYVNACTCYSPVYFAPK